MRVVLFRHGPAGPRDERRWPDDRQRPLTERGELRTRAAAAGLARFVDDTARLFTSPLTRCAQTAVILSEVLALKESIDLLDALAPRGSARDVFRCLQDFHSDETVILVGHEPDLGKLAGVMVLGAPSPLPLKKAGACAVSFDGAPGPGNGTLQWLLSPRMLRSLGHKKSKV